MHKEILTQIRIWGFVVGFLLSTSSAFAQALTPEAKARTLNALQLTIKNRAYVPGVDFGKVAQGIEAQKATLDSANDMRSFSTAVNGVLRDLGISRIRLLTPAAALSVWAAALI
ncbi:MAG: hypothetical protein QM758_04510 [Armatimonas sp.]